MVEGWFFFLVINTDESIPSWLDRKEIINHLELLGISPNGVESSGQLPRGIGFESYHQCMYMDIALMDLIGLAPDNPVKNTES